MGQANCRAPETPPESPAIGHRLKGSTMTAPRICENPDVNAALLNNHQSSEDYFEVIQSKVKSSKEFMEAIKSISSTAEAYSQMIEPLGDWSFVDQFELPRVCEAVRRSLTALDIQKHISNAQSIHQISTTASTAAGGSACSKILTDDHLYVLAMSSPHACASVAGHDAADLLFSLNKEGESWGRFVDRLDGYQAPLILVASIRDMENVRVGAYIAEGLIESGAKFQGSPDSFLFGFTSNPSAKSFYTIRRTSRFETNFTMLNRSSQYMPKGIGFGGDDKQPRLLINSDFRKITILLACRTYESGPLFDDGIDQEYLTEYDLDDLEVWGFGGEEAARAQSSQKAITEEMKNERRKVDIAKMMGGDPTGLMKKNVQAGERQGEAEAIIEERKREREDKGRSR